jgi:TatD DNase family protein
MTLPSLEPSSPDSSRQFIDTHCHFDFAAFDVDRNDVWKSCVQRGVAQMIVPGVAPDQWGKAAQLSERYAGISHAAGVHPWWVDKLVQGEVSKLQLADLREQLTFALKVSKCIALGECGLDGAIATPLTTQQQILEVHLELAQALKKPLIIHCHKAHNELIAQLKHHQLAAGGVIHAFSGSLEMAQTYHEMGFLLGIGGTITYERAKKTRNAIKHIALDALVLESDAPDMPLQGRQGQRNSPELLPLIAQALAELREVPVNEITRATSANARQLFALA